MFLTPKQYAEHWNVGYSTVMRCIHNGRLAAHKIGSRDYRIDENTPIKEPEIELDIKETNDFLKALEAI